MMNNYKLYIFDWDGTLMNSINFIVTSMQAAFTVANLPVPSNEEVKAIIGLSLFKAVKQLSPKLSNERCDEITVLYKQQYAALDKSALALFDGAYDLLVELHSQGKQLAVATGKSRDGLELLFEKTNTKHFFNYSKTIDEAISKPDPDMIYQILQLCNVERHEAVMIGDSNFDIEMATNASIDSIGVTMGAISRAKLIQYNPKVIVDSINELSSLIT